jgi:outer membrane protein TolC
VPRLKLENQEDLKVLELKTALSSNKQKLIKSGFYPKLNILAGIKYGKPGVDIFANDWMTYGVIGLGLNWDIFNWGTDKYALSAEKANYRKNSYQIEVKKDHLLMEYDKLQRELESLQKKSEVLRTARSVAEQKMKTIQQQSENGIVSISEFNEANQELTQAEMSYRQQLVLIAQKHHEIEYKSGKQISEWRLQ